jgi:hypothetical protein
MDRPARGGACIFQDEAMARSGHLSLAWRSIPLASMLAFAALAGECAAAQDSSANAAQTPTASATLIEQRIIAQQGLAIPLGQAVLQSQLLIFISVAGNLNTCSNLGYGSIKVTGHKVVGAKTTATATIYFDTQCKSIYLQAPTMLVAKSGSLYDVTETATYHNSKGATVGKLVLKLTGVLSGSIDAAGTGTFTPSNGAPAAHLGLVCKLASSSSCTGAVAQTFKSPVNLDLGSVTSLALKFKMSGSLNKVSFKSSRVSRFKGNAGKLKISIPSNSLPVITGGTSYGTDSVVGSQANFALFSPPPTSWSITDTAHGTKFSMSMGSKGSYSGAITQISNGKKLASIAVDQSGTGTITYSDNTKAAISTWLLAN